MTGTILTVPGAGGDGIGFNSGNDGTFTLAVGPTGAKVNALVFDAGGHASMPQNVVAFSAYQSVSQSVPNASFTKLQFQTKEFDTAAAFDNTTNYRFQPTVSGYYQISGEVAYTGAFTGQVIIYKNGVAYKNGSSGSANQFFAVSALVYLNGSTDYVELWTYQSQGTSQSVATGSAPTYFQGILVAKA